MQFLRDEELACLLALERGRDIAREEPHIAQRLAEHRLVQWCGGTYGFFCLTGEGCKTLTQYKQQKAH